MCLKIWGKSGIIQAGAEELKKKKKKCSKSLLVKFGSNGLEIREKEYSGAFLFDIAFALIQ